MNWLALLGLLGSPAPVLTPESGRFTFTPVDDQRLTPERYRLAAGSYDYRLTPRHTLPGCEVDVYTLTFPSPAPSPHAENNTVHAEYYRPHGPGPFPGVVVLDILAGDGRVSRAIATYFAQNRIAALYVHMAYYGPRRPLGPRVRMISTDVPRTLSAVRQTVLDIRVAAAWLAARPEVDRRRLGIHGTSLGSFVACLAAEMEPRFTRTSLALGGGGLVDAFYDHPQAKLFRAAYELVGGTKESVKLVLSPVDPLTCAGNLRGRDVFIVAAKRDEVVPPAAAWALIAALGSPQVVWYDTTHYGAALFLPDILPRAAAFFRADRPIPRGVTP